MMNVVVDANEKDRIPLAIKKLDAVVVDLPVGDYVFNGEVVFEYKTFPDFCSSIMDNRVFNQGFNQRLEYKYHFIVLELGEDFNLEDSLDEHEYRSGVCVTSEQYYGAIARLNTYTTVLPVCGDSMDCFHVMEVQARKCLEGKILCKYPEINTGNSAMNFLCNDVRGIGPAKAEVITDCLGLECLEDLLGLTKERLVSVEGVGLKTAESILKQIRR